MLRPGSRVCLACQVARSPRTLLSTSLGACQTRRAASQLQKKLPSRLSLSSRVAQSTPKVAPSGKPVKRRQAGPFGGMNLKEARIRGVPERPSSAQLKRSSRRGNQDEKKPEREGFHALKMQRALASPSYSHRAAIKSRISNIESFNEFPLLPTIKESIGEQALPNMQNIKPTAVQRVAIPTLLGERPKFERKRPLKDKEEFLIAAETGSGKTLAYLLPTIDAIKRAEAIEVKTKVQEEQERIKRNPFELPSPPLSNDPHDKTGRPQAIILVPTAELVAQVGALTKSLSHKVKFRAALISSAFSGKVIRSRLYSPQGVDILISTPHLLSSIAESDPNILSRVTHLVCDEADSLFDRSFSPITSAIIDRATPSLKQLILCSATIPRSLDNFLRQRFPDIRRLTTPNLHAIPRRVQLSVVDVEKEPYKGNKNLACADTIWTIGKAASDHEGQDKTSMDMTHIIVFVNERETSQEVADYLKSKGIDAIALNRDTSEQRTSEILTDFTNGQRETVVREIESHHGTLAENQPNYVPLGQAAPPVKRRLPGVKVLVMTDLGSRGIDTLAVRHVLLYDVPHSTIDFIHRLGRTGRMGRRGRGIVLVGKHDRRDVVAEVREGMFKGQALI